MKAKAVASVAGLLLITHLAMMNEKKTKVFDIDRN